MLQKDRYKKFINYFLKTNPNPTTELIFKNDYELLVSVILSAQCTDKRVNATTPSFFSKFPTISSLAKANKDDIFFIIKSISYPNNKSKHLLGMANMLKNQYNSKIPSNIDELQKLPGVGRKTANVIVSILYDKPAMAVDTHVFRVANRIGLTINAKNPLSAEKQLVNNIPKKIIPKAHHWLILHGRYICKARNPLCLECGLISFCKNYIKNKN